MNIISRPIWPILNKYKHITQYPNFTNFHKREIAKDRSEWVASCIFPRISLKKKNLQKKSNLVTENIHSYPWRKLHLCDADCCWCCWIECWGVDLGVAIGLPGLVMPSRPLDNLSISAPKAWRANMAEGGGSLSGSQSSWVSSVVSSVSVDVPEVCCGVPPLPAGLLLNRNRFHVPFLSRPERKLN